MPLFAPPTFNGPAIARLETLNISASDTNLYLFLAPPGFGKTILMAQWYNTEIAQGKTCLWISAKLSPRHDLSFEQLFQAALSASLSEITSDHLEPSSPPTLTNLTDPFILFLDDWDDLASQNARESLETLISFMPKGSRIIISGNSHKNLAFPAMEARGLIKRFGVKELAFSLAETRKVAEETPPEFLQKIHQYCGGWPVAILRARSLCQCLSEPNSDLIDSLRQDRFLIDYVTTVLLDPLNLSLKNLLQNAVLLKSFDSMAIETVFNLQHAEQSRFDLMADGYILTKKQNIFNLFSPLITDILRDQYRRSNPKPFKNFHHKAAQYFSDNDQIVEAHYHALKSEKPELAAEILERAGGFRLLAHEGFETLTRLLSGIPAHIRKQKPRLELSYIISLIINGRLFEAKSLYQHLKDKTKNFACDFNGIANKDLYVDSKIAEIYFAQYGQRPIDQEMVQSMEDILKNSVADNSRLITFALFFLANCHQRWGNLWRAQAMLEEIRKSFQASETSFRDLFLAKHAFLINMAAGRLNEATKCYLDATKINATRNRSGDEIETNLLILRAEIKYYQNDLKASVKIVNTIDRNIFIKEYWYDILTSAYTTSSHLAYVTKGFDQAMLALTRFEEIAAQRGLPSLATLSIAYRISFCSLSGKLDQATEIITQHKLEETWYEICNAPLTTWREKDAMHAALCRFFIRTGQLENAEKIIPSMIQEASTNKRLSPLIQSKCFMAFNLQEKGELDGALEELCLAIIDAAQEGYKRIFLDEGEPMALLFQKIISKGLLDGAEENFAVSIMEAFGHRGGAAGNNAIFSIRQREVLGQLCEGYSNKVIARNLDISENSVKFHLKNIFKILDISHRSHAIHAAKERGLI